MSLNNAILSTRITFRIEIGYEIVNEIVFSEFEWEILQPIYVYKNMYGISFCAQYQLAQRNK